MPKAVKAAGEITEAEWNESGSDFEVREAKMRQTVSDIDNAAKLVKKNEMSKADFKKKYGIEYDKWIASTERNTRYNLILDSSL